MITVDQPDGLLLALPNRDVGVDEASAQWKL